MSFSEDNNEISASTKAENFRTAVYQKFVPVYESGQSINNQKYAAISYTSPTIMRVCTMYKIKSGLASF